MAMCRPWSSATVLASSPKSRAAGWPAAFLRARIGLVGASQAGWIIPVAAARARPAFMIILAGPTVSVGEEIFYSDLVERTTRPLELADRELLTFSGDRGFDPRPVLQSIDVPGLWLLGDNDRSIPIPVTVGILRELASGGKPFAHVVFPGVGHDLAGAPFWDEIDRWLPGALPGWVADSSPPK